MIPERMDEDEVAKMIAGWQAEDEQRSEANPANRGPRISMEERQAHIEELREKMRTYFRQHHNGLELDPYDPDFPEQMSRMPINNDIFQPLWTDFYTNLRIQTEYKMAAALAADVTQMNLSEVQKLLRQAAEAAGINTQQNGWESLLQKLLEDSDKM